MKAIFDTNIMIDYLNGIPQAKEEMKRFTIKGISIITYIEIGVGLEDFLHVKKIEDFIRHHFDIVPVHQEIANLAIIIRKKYKLKIPDALIFSTAQHMNALLITRDVKDFPTSNPIIRIPYHL